MRMLIPGKVPEDFFWALIELSPLRSEKVVRALRDFLVLGYTRKEACEKYGVSYGYFSVALKRIRHVNNIIYQLMHSYISESSCKDRERNKSDTC
ncbi:PapB/FocB family fimbrial expression transcriptional regulator [Escherichia coli]|uniref:PapB/FocB family fimbrial expression transcriptional regulator n=1 Tax=Escherichia coli TaxID=562 RepID=UPI000D162E86|nr:PapB/FocB family fimbrial expression transcriptional regulator [Escherichia coli]EFB8334500.1 transcriptional regulator [Escherichia coli]EKS1146461.1 transcriptional regulator [Escherichia coli]PSY61758.1 transcriptional regulator [Escherichia coli]HDX5440222.1 transcriptional regulator [Escherichia coli]